jgi:hypothetical protein
MPRPLFYILWLAPSAAQVAIVAVMAQRKLWRSFPFFFSYLCFELGRTTVLLQAWIRHKESFYFYGYWCGQGLGAIAILAVIWELFSHAFCHYAGLKRLGNLLFLWAAVVLSAIAVAVAFESPAGDFNRLMASIMIVKRSVTLVETGLIGFLFLFAAGFAIRLRRYALGIAAGLAIYGSVDLLGIVLRTHYGRSFNDTFAWLIMLTNSCCVMIWALHFLMPETAKVVPDETVQAKRLQQWNTVLTELMNK